MANGVSILIAASSRKELEIDARHRRDKCMECTGKPKYEVLWAEGRGHAWFCEKHLKEWVREQAEECLKEGFPNLNCGINAIKKVENNEVAKKWGENKNSDILDKILHEIRPKVDLTLLNKEKQKERTTEIGKEARSKAVEDEEAELAPVYPSGANEQEEITLEEIMPFFKSFYKAKPYVSLVGGLANNGRTEGDIDILIRSGIEDVATEFRVYRMFPPEYRNRVHIIYPKIEDGNLGGYTNYIDLFDLKLESREVKHIELMSEIDERKGVKLFTFSKLLKPAHGRYKGEMYSVDSLIELVNTKPDWYEKKIVVNVKYDGIHCRVDHSKEGAVKIFTEEGNEITDKLPAIVSELKEICKGHDVVIVGELESWKEGKHQARQLTTAIIHTKGVHEDAETLKLNIFDILYYGDDIHNLDYSERLKFLNKLPNSKHIIKAENKIVNNAEDLRKAVALFSSREGSEGSYLKRYDFPYELDGKSLLNLKYKNTFSIDAQVEEVHEVKGGKSWNYRCVLKDGNKKIPIGKTYNTGIKLKAGDIVKVSFVNLNKYFDLKQKKVFYNWWSPRVIMAREDKKNPDNSATADKLVETSHGENKTRISNIQIDTDPYMTLPDEEKKWLGMLHIHGRGKSIHGDLRFEVSKDWAIGWTLYIPKGLPKVPESYTEFIELVKKEVMPVLEEKLNTPTLRILCGKKEPEPSEWLDYRGMVEPGEIGATKNEPGFFYIADRFEVEFGAAKSHYHEYFFTDSKLFGDRFCVRLLENKEEWEKTGEGLMAWMGVAPKEKTPYVISRRAVNKKWIPGFGHSALPRKMRAKVPESYKYWKYREQSKQREVRDALVDELGKSVKVEGDAMGPAIYKVFRQTWKGQTVIREGPARTRYYFTVCQESKGNVKFALSSQNNPLENKEVACIRFDKAAALCALNEKVTEVKPESDLNETKNTPSKIELLERGKMSILSNTNFRRFRLRDGKMEGSWNAFQREEGSAIWTLREANPE